MYYLTIRAAACRLVFCSVGMDGRNLLKHVLKLVFCYCEDNGRKKNDAQHVLLGAVSFVFNKDCVLDLFFLSIGNIARPPTQRVVPDALYKTKSTRQCWLVRSCFMARAHLVPSPPVYDVFVCDRGEAKDRGRGGLTGRLILFQPLPCCAVARVYYKSSNQL